MRLKQSVALTERNTTGPPYSVGRPRDDDDRRQPAKQFRPIGRASNKTQMKLKHEK